MDMKGWYDAKLAVPPLTGPFFSDQVLVVVESSITNKRYVSTDHYTAKGDWYIHTKARYKIDDEVVEATETVLYWMPFPEMPD